MAAGKKGAKKNATSRSDSASIPVSLLLTAPEGQSNHRFTGKLPGHGGIQKGVDRAASADTPRWEESTMRSDKVFPAVRAVRNRYLLCQLAAQATRKFHRPSKRVQDTMNDVFKRFAQAETPETLVAQKTLAPAERRAA